MDFIRLHGGFGQIVHQAQVVFTLRPYVDVAAVRVLETEPWNRFRERIDVPGPRNHYCLSLIPGRGLEKPDLEDRSAHR